MPRLYSLRPLLHRTIKTTFPVLCLLGVLGHTSLATTTDTAIKKVVTDYYDAVATGECEKAARLRLGYSVQKCQKVSTIHLYEVDVAYQDSKNAVVLIDTDIESGKKQFYFRGYTRLKKINGKWYIVGPYKNGDDYTLEEYRAEFIAAEKKPDSVHHKQTSKSLPPADPIDLSPETQPTSSLKEDIPEPKKTAKPKPRPSTIRPNTKAKLSHSKAGTRKRTELDDYLDGIIRIQGNHKIILDNIHHLFPDNESDIILVDLSLALLYYYDSDNEQVGIFPVLTTPLTLFPKGLFKIHEKELQPISGDQVVAPSLTLEKLVVDENGELLVEGYYYLRDYFDSDQKNSLSLSPVDNIRLNKLISHETLLYIAR